MEEVYPNIFMITETGAMGAIMPQVNIYVISGEDGLIFDTGYGRKKILQHLEKELHRIKEIVTSRGGKFNITRALPSHSHPDHFSGLKFLKKQFKTRTLLTEKMSKNLNAGKHYYSERFNNKYSKRHLKNILNFIAISYIQPFLLGSSFDINPDEIIKENKPLFINNEPWQVLSSPGHCEDHISLYNEETGVLFSGDNILRAITTWLGPPRSNLQQYNRTMENILALPKLELILSAHGSPITEPRQRIKDILQHRKERTQTVLTLIEKRGRRGISCKEIINHIYKDDPLPKKYLADGWIALTLEDLENKRQIKYTNARIYKT